MVLAHLRAHPELDFSPAELANALGRPTSRGAIIRSCHLFTAAGLAIRTQDRPQRYRAAPLTPPAVGAAAASFLTGPRPVDPTVTGVDPR
jgi:hypothetical protein